MRPRPLSDLCSAHPGHEICFIWAGVQITGGGVGISKLEQVLNDRIGGTPVYLRSITAHLIRAEAVY